MHGPILVTKSLTLHVRTRLLPYINQSHGKYTTVACGHVTSLYQIDSCDICPFFIKKWR
jgi:hypothetical protein